VRRVAAVPLLVWLAAIAAPASAGAGTYQVTACANVAGGAPGAFTAVADPGMAAYKECPNHPSRPASGLVTRASANAGPARVPFFAGAYQIFEAPPGAGLASVTFDHATIRLAQHWTTGIVAYDGDFNVGSLPYGCYAGLPGCGLGTPSFFGPVTVNLNGHARFRFETRCGAAQGCDITASGFNPATRALFSAANVVVRVNDSTPPAIVPEPSALWGDGWHRGNEAGWQGLYDNVGVMALRLYADGRLVWAQDFRDSGWPDHVRCDFTRPRPCNNITPGGVRLDTATLEDGEHSIRIEAIDAAGNASAIERRIRTDNTAPAHVAASVGGGEGWRRTNDFTVAWPLPPQGSGSPITRVHYVVCALPARADSCTRGSRDSAGIESLSSVKVPNPGEFALRVWLEDAAGNASEANASAAVRLRLDDAAPEGVFELLDERDPRRLDVRVADVGSGVAGGAVELRRAGHRQWHELSTALEGNVLRALVDDVGLPDGDYEARAIMRDLAGNERIADRREDGARMTLSLPVRTGSRIALGRRVLRGPGVVRGRLTSAFAEPVPRAAVTVIEQPRSGSSATRASGVTTDTEGRFTYQVGRGVSRSLRFKFAGTDLLKPADVEARVRVPARTTIGVSRRRLLNGQAVRFVGRLLGTPVPEGGKLIDLQAFYRGRWRTIATPRANERGRWGFKYRFEATSGLVRYRFRARVRREASYPYELGYSRVVTVTVRGP